MEDTAQNQLESIIIEEMNKRPEQRITFYEYMNMALYYPDLGYYTKDRTKIGKEADFYTSSSVHPIFGQTIANHFLELFPNIKENGRYSLLEIGGGNGRLARDILDYLKLNHADIYQNLSYYMLETSPYHRKLQLEYVNKHEANVKWINRLEDLPQPFSGIIFSNELVDAFPVHRVKKVNGSLEEIYVTWDGEENSFEEVTGALSSSQLDQYFTDLGLTLREGQVAEVNIDALSWIKDVANALDKGYLLTIDYGYPAEELYGRERHEGSLMCYYQHTANDNPYQNIGMQDITSHVNFTALIQHGEVLGLEEILFTTQMNFLIHNGIFEHLTEIGLEEISKRDMFHDEAQKKNRAIRHLISPEGMGETFKFLLQQKNISKKDYKFLSDFWSQYGL